MNATGQTAEILEVTAGQAGKWRAASAAVTGSIMVGFMPIITLQLFKAGISAPSMLVWRYGLALVPLAAASAMAGHNFQAARRGVANCCGRGDARGRANAVLLGEPAHPRHQHRDPLVLYLSGADLGARPADLQAADPNAGGAVRRHHPARRPVDHFAGPARRRPRSARARVDFAVADNLRAL